MSRRLRKGRQIKRFIGAAAFFALGGTTAAALSLSREPARASAAEQPVSVAPDRIAVPAAAVRQALADGLIDRPIKTILNVPKRMTYGDYRWDDKGVPAGPIWIRVDPAAQLLSVFRGGHEIGTAVILYGASDVPTPTGKFPILAKLKDHRSATYDGAPMPYTLRLTADGVSIHGSDVRWGYATHGCIGVPKEFAARLFNAASVGDEVFIERS
jgi:lipoprotein-anchoring transpeptidase ErfK/SrfK